MKRFGECEPTTIHTLKGSPLSWCGKQGLAPEVRLLLGHHSSGKHSADTYARDVLAHCVSMKGCFNRSGLDPFVLTTPGQDRFQRAPKLILGCRKSMSLRRRQQLINPTNQTAASRRPLPANPNPVSPCAWMSKDEQDAAEEDKVVKPSSWEPDVLMYQHHRSLIVHVMACGTTNNRFSCGIS